MTIVTWVANVDPFDHTQQISLRNGTLHVGMGQPVDLIQSEIDSLSSRCVFIAGASSGPLPPEFDHLVAEVGDDTIIYRDHNGLKVSLDLSALIGVGTGGGGTGGGGGGGTGIAATTGLGPPTTLANGALYYEQDSSGLFVAEWLGTTTAPSLVQDFTSGFAQDYATLGIGSVVKTGTLVVNNGVLYRRIATGTVSGTFTATNWAPVFAGAVIQGVGVPAQLELGVLYFEEDSSGNALGIWLGTTTLASPKKILDTTSPNLYGPLANRPAPSTVIDSTIYWETDPGGGAAQVRAGAWVPINVGGGASTPAIDSAGNLGATHTLALTNGGQAWLIGNLTADLTLTLSGGFSAGTRVMMFLKQDTTPRALTITNGSISRSVTIPTTAGVKFQVEGRFTSATELQVFTNTPAVLDYTPAPPSTGTFTEYAVPTSPPVSNICVGSDGNLWVALEASSAQILRVTTAGVMTFFTLPRVGNLGGVCNGPDGRVWFTEFTNNYISAIDVTTGVVTSWALAAGANLAGCCRGSDGNVWFCTTGDNKVSKITPTGTITGYTVPTTAAFPHGPNLGWDGNVWFTEQNKDKIAKITPTGTITEYATGITASSKPYVIAAGPDGNMWFTEFQGNKIGRITTSGTVTEFTVPTSTSTPGGITAGPDGNVWFTEKTGNKIGRITPTGTITEFVIPTSASNPDKIVMAPDNMMWFTEHDTFKVSKVVP